MDGCHQNLRSPRSNILADGHSYDIWPLPPQVPQIMVVMQLRLMCPGLPHKRQVMSRKGPPCISEEMVVFRQFRARCPETLHRLQTGSFVHSRAMCPGWRQLLQARSLVQSTAMWPGLKHLLHSLLDPELGQSRARWPVLLQVWHRASFLHSVAMWPDCLQFQQTVSEVHSAAKCLFKITPKKKLAHFLQYISKTKRWQQKMEHKSKLTVLGPKHLMITTSRFPPKWSRCSYIKWVFHLILPWKIASVACSSRLAIPSKVTRPPAILAYKIPGKLFILTWLFPWGFDRLYSNIQKKKHIWHN